MITPDREGFEGGEREEEAVVGWFEWMSPSRMRLNVQRREKGKSDGSDIECFDEVMLRFVRFDKLERFKIDETGKEFIQEREIESREGILYFDLERFDGRGKGRVHVEEYVLQT